MAFSSGSQRDLYYAIEDSYGVGPDPLAMSEVRNTEDSISLAKDNFVSNERRGDRGIHDVRMGNKQPAGDVSFEFSYASFDDFMLAALGAPRKGASVTGETVTLVASTGVLSGTGTAWLTDGFAVGDEITLSGFDDDGNNGAFIISAVADDEITVSDPTGMVNVAVAESDIAIYTTGWVAPYNALAVNAVASSVGNSLTRSVGSWLTDGVKVGDTLVITGFSTETGNNVTAKVLSVSATVVTLDATLVTATADDGVFNTSSLLIKKGDTITSFAVEKVFSDIGEYQLYTGGVVNTMSLDITPNSMITGSFGMIFKDAANAQSAYHSGTPSSVSTYSPFDAFTGYINEGGSALAQASSLSFSLDNGFQRNFVLMQDTARQVTSGKSNVTGSVTLYFENSTVYDKFVEEEESSLEFQLEDASTNSYVISLPRVKYTSADTPVSSDDAIINTMNFQAMDDATQASNIVVRKQPAIA